MFEEVDDETWAAVAEAMIPPALRPNMFLARLFWPVQVQAQWHTSIDLQDLLEPRRFVLISATYGNGAQEQVAIPEDGVLALAEFLIDGVRGDPGQYQCDDSDEVHVGLAEDGSDPHC